MLLRFIGAPCSGKTTTAAMVFSALKNDGAVVEFIPEQARFYIARRRLELKLQPAEQLVLTPEDQEAIFRQQFINEHMLLQVGGPSVVVVTDSSPFNSLLYMAEDHREKFFQSDIWKKFKTWEETTKHKVLNFYSPLVTRSKELDANRIHSEQQSYDIDQSISAIFEKAYEGKGQIIALDNVVAAWRFRDAYRHYASQLEVK